MKYELLIIFLMIPFVAIDVFAEPILKHSEFSVETFVDGLSFPTTMGFIEDKVIVLEKNSGQVRLIQNGVLQESPLLDFNVDQIAESGLLGILVDGEHVYIYLTEAEVEGEEQNANRIYQYTWDGNQLINQKLIHEFPPSLNKAHVGGIMVKNANNEIFVIIGDMDSRNYDLNGPTQNSENYPVRDTGIILKIVKDGSVLQPVESEIPSEHYYAIGIRNSFGMAIDPLTDKLWDTENGSWEFDEINLVEEKFNSGWEKIMGPATQSQIESLPKFGNFEYSDPEFSWQKTVSPTALTFVNSEKFLNNKNNLLVADCNNGNIYEFKLNDERNKLIFKNKGLQDNVLNNIDSMSELIFGTGFGCITDLKFGPNGELYIVSLTEGKIFRIIPIPNNNQNQNDIRPFVDLTNKDLKLKKFFNADLRFANFTKSNLSGANFSNANLLNAEFNKAIIENADFSNSNLKHAIFQNTILKNSILDNADLLGTYFGYSNLENVDLKNAKIKSSNFTYANLSNADLEEVDLRASDMSHVDFSGANLKDVRLSHSDLSYVDFSGADLTGLYYHSSDITGVITNNETKIDGCFGQDLWNKGLSMIFRKMIQNEDFISETIKNIIPHFCI
jgi:aldose sugar dehydrogenase